MQNSFIKEVTEAVNKFDTEKITVIQSNNTEGNIQNLSKKTGSYLHSQKELLADIDFAYNSVYKNGKYDKQGQRKLYINIVRFYTQVAVKNTDVDTKNFVFTPTDYTTENIWSIWFMSRQFKTWVRDSGFAKTINDLNYDFNKYGTCVSKRLRNDIVRVRLNNIKCDQSAETLLEGIRGGTPFVEAHEFSYVQIQDYKGWKPVKYYKGKRAYYEVYAYVKKQDFLLMHGDITEKEYDHSDESMTFVMAMMMPSGKYNEDKRKKYNEEILFIEELDECDFPYDEAHSEKQDGRWLGIGNVEKQLENQIARNSTVNLRRRSMLWSSKKIYQSQGDAVNKNLIKEVEDGQVLQVGTNGLISEVNTATRSLADYRQDEEVWDENSQKQAFAFESATGESFASGTPFRLGAMLSNSVMSYFDKQREIFGLFLKDTFYQQIITIFQNRAKDDIVSIAQTEEGYKLIKEMFVNLEVDDYYCKIALDPKTLDADIVPSVDEVRAEIDKKMIKSPYLFVNVQKKIYKTAKARLDLNLTGESQDSADKETLTTLYTELSRKGDPRAERVLEVLLGTMGKNLKSIAGVSLKPAELPQGPSGKTNPNLAGLVPKQE